MSILEKEINGWHVWIDMDDVYNVVGPDNVIRFSTRCDREADKVLNEMATADQKKITQHNPK